MEEEVIAPKILFVDDEENILKSLKRLLSFENYEVYFANSGAAGLELLSHTKVDIIISDMRMPQMQGDEFLQKAKEICPNSIRFILSGFSDFQSTINALNNGGIHQFISKPWDDDDLLARINEASEFIKVRKDRDRLRILAARQNKRLKEMNKSLEERVAARTSELEQTAAMLDLSYQEVKNSYNKFIDVFAQLLQLRSSAPRQYLHDVAETAQAVAEKVGLNKDQQFDVYQAAKLHELGKIKLSDTLLNKPIAQLTNQELKEYREYPMQGYAILASLENLTQVSNIIKSHCEQMNGAGFPEHLVGAQIPIEVRILTIVMHYYLYRHGMQTGKAHTSKEAQDYIRDIAGEIVDQNLTLPLFEIVDERERQSGKHEVRFSLDEVLPGMMLSRDLFNLKGMIMLTKGTMLTDKIITKLNYIAERERYRYTLYVMEYSLGNAQKTE